MSTYLGWPRPSTQPISAKTQNQRVYTWPIDTSPYSCLGCGKGITIERSAASALCTRCEAIREAKELGGEELAELTRELIPEERTLPFGFPKINMPEIFPPSPEDEVVGKIYTTDNTSCTAVWTEASSIPSKVIYFDEID